MKDVIYLTDSGGTMGFTVQKEILEGLEVDIGDMVEIELFIEFKGESSFTITRPLRYVGGSKGITLKKKLINELNLKPKDSIRIDIRLPKENKS